MMVKNSQTNLADLKVMKALAEREFSGIEGVQGLGIGDQCLRVYVRNRDVEQKLPRIFHGTPLEFVVTGSVSALHD
jgi:hypothetical protein